MIGFGRFGQVVSQALLARGVEVSIIDADVEMIRAAQGFGFTVYYGDGTRLDVLRASGAGKARQIAVCVEKRGTRRSYRRAGALGVSASSSCSCAPSIASMHGCWSALASTIRSEKHSSRRCKPAAPRLRLLEVSESEIADILTAIRERDAERFALEIAGGGYEAGLGMLLRNTPQTPSRPDAVQQAAHGRQGTQRSAQRESHVGRGRRPRSRNTRTALRRTP